MKWILFNENLCRYIYVFDFGFNWLKFQILSSSPNGKKKVYVMLGGVLEMQI